ncbi:MAG: quinolinate synthase NadA [Methanotrichaceae archaeon]|nr:quinolinate synthase NadA [Methanotrichaceae archaeon]
MMIEEILSLKQEQDAVILAHNYQPGPIQEIANLVGDSLELSRAAAELKNKIIIFCGVDFMAETAAILSPEKTVILPEKSSFCPMAQMITSDQLRKMKTSYPEAATVCYVNTTAAIKAECDICCTSANGIQVVKSLKEEQVIFVPDRNLAAYVARYTQKKIIPWDGYCYVHDQFRPEDVLESRKICPSAEVLVHPECRPEVIDLADYVYSTSGMAKHAKSSKSKEFIIGTEVGMLYRLRKDNPEKKFFPLSEKAVCENMKKTDLEKVHRALQTLEPKVVVAERIAIKARQAIERMLAI